MPRTGAEHIRGFDVRIAHSAFTAFAIVHTKGEKLKRIIRFYFDRRMPLAEGAPSSVNNGQSFPSRETDMNSSFLL